MGYLHEGHQSLVKQAAKDNDRVVISIFVNPTQFGPNEDLERYPRDLDRDLALSEAAGAHAAFHPEPEIMYPAEFHTQVEVRDLTQGLCGRSRPTHFVGVCTVVCKLFNIIGPDRAYFGQKDAQQLAVIKRMAADLDMSVDVIGCPIVREPDGLAKSSRNAYLTPDGRAAALVLNRSLRLAAKAATGGERDSGKLIALIEKEMAGEPLVQPDYIEIVHPESMRPLRRLSGPALIAVAANVGKARLLDNILLDIPE